MSEQGTTKDLFTCDAHALDGKVQEYSTRPLSAQCHVCGVEATRWYVPSKDLAREPSKDWMTRWSALQLAGESTQGIAASTLFCEVVAEIGRLQRDLAEAQPKPGECMPLFDRAGHCGMCTACGKNFTCGAKLTSQPPGVVEAVSKSTMEGAKVWRETLTDAIFDVGEGQQ